MSYENYRVEVLPLSVIDKGKRYREDYKDVHALARGIEEKGLINPIAVYERPDPIDEDPYLLLAGGRRLKAHEVLKIDQIPCRIYDKELTDLQIRGIELEENLNREDLNYIEEINLKKEIHELQVAIYGKKVSTSPDAPGHSMRDTANLLNIAPASLSRDLKIADAMQKFPELQWDRIKNKQDAFKLVTSIEGSIGRMQTAKIVEAKIGSTDKQKKTLFDAYNINDFFVGIESLPNSCFDLVEIDPPYAIDLQKVKKGYNYEGYNEVPVEEYPEFIQSVLAACYTKMADNSWIILWFGPDPWYSDMHKWLEGAGFNTTGLVGIWAKGADPEGTDIIESCSGQTHMPNSRLANAYEMFYYAWKGTPTLGKPGSSNVFGFKPVPASRKSHPTERPLELMSDILTTFGVEGSRVLVPFAGSGNTLISAIQSKMFPIGFDLTQAYKDSYIIKVDAMF